MAPYKRKEVIGDCTLYLGDCLDVMPTLDKVDAVVTDPPYGIGADLAAHKRSGKKPGAAAAPYGEYACSDWDSVPATREHIKHIMTAGVYQVIFGGNYFDLPPARCLLIWDKITGSNGFTDCEVAWTNLDKAIRIKHNMWSGMLRKGGEDRVGHPTQKPVEVMQWCIEHLPEGCQAILDPFMGSGTTGVACAKMGRKFIGIEINKEYYEIAKKRIFNTQGSLF